MKCFDNRLKNKITDMYERNNWKDLKKISNVGTQNQSAFSEVYEINDDLIIKVFKQKEYVQTIKEDGVATYDYEPLLELQKTNLVPKIFFWEPEKYVVMEKIKGNTLYDLYKKGILVGEYKEGLFKRIEGLFKIIIKNGWTPSDIKPFHVFVTNDEEIKFIDFTMYTRAENPDDSLFMAKLNFDEYLRQYLK